MRILLTGSGGMAGRNILGHERAARFEWLAPRSSELDLRNAAGVRDYLRLNRPDMVVHAAGVVGGIQANIREPVRFFVDNLDIGRNIILGAREQGIRSLLNLSCSCMYPRNAPNPLTEDSLLQGELEPTNEGYALARIAAARLCQYIAKEDPAFQYKTLVSSNLYGRFDKFDPAHSHMVPAVIAKIHAAKEAGKASVDIWGDGTAMREFMYAGDLADCVIAACERFESLPQICNVGPGQDCSIDEYYRSISAVVGFSGTFEHDLSKPGGMKRKLLDVTRVREWGWRASTSLADGLRATYDFYLSGPH